MSILSKEIFSTKEVMLAHALCSGVSKAEQDGQIREGFKNCLWNFLGGRLKFFFFTFLPFSAILYDHKTTNCYKIKMKC
jgi:hypothetical protein